MDPLFQRDFDFISLQVAELPSYIALSIPRPHWRELRFKFCNVSEVEAEARFLLAENNSECFSVEPQELLVLVRDRLTTLRLIILTFEYEFSEIDRPFR